MKLINLYGLQYGDLIAFNTNGGVRCQGIYQSDIGNVTDTFLFLNHSNGKVETVHLSEIEGLELMAQA